MASLHSNELNTISFLLTEDIYILDKKSINPIVNIENAIKTDSSEPAQTAENPSSIAIPKIAATTPSQVTTEIKKTQDFTYIGENNKYFLILIEDEKHPEISPIHKETLLKIMGAKGLELRDLAVLNLNLFPDTNVNELKGFFSCSQG